MITQGKWEVEVKSAFMVDVVAEGDIVCRIEHDGSHDDKAESYKHAHLIAAAPELLAACKTAVRLLSANTTLDAGDPANIAISKAIALALANQKSTNNLSSMKKLSLNKDYRQAIKARLSAELKDAFGVDFPAEMVVDYIAEGNSVNLSITY